MVRFVNVSNITRWAAEKGVENVISGMIEYLEHDFRRWPAFDKSPRVANHSPLGVIELMPTRDGETYGFKYLTGPPANPGNGSQTVTAFSVLADIENGYPMFWSELTILT